MFYEVGEKVGNWKIYADSGELLQEKDYTKTL
jgi:antitoxin component YwqK of YwqJK toxin-antitoxin module